MFSKDTLTACLKVLVLSFLMLAIFLLVSRRAEVVPQAQDVERLLPVQVLQLPAPWRNLVTLRCDRALVATKEIKTFTCFLNNNSSKDMVAGSLDISVVLDVQGTMTRQQSLLSFDTFLHPDFRAEHPQNLIAPGTDYRLQDSSSVFDDPVTNLVAAIDYVEFSDGTTIGPDRGGSQVIKGQREGARKYKDWLAAKYSETHSVNAIVPFLADDSLPPELKLTDSNEERGAKILRVQERHLYETKGPDGLLKHLEPSRKNR